MRITSDTNSGQWVRLERHGARAGLQRWPGPHRPRAVIATSEGGHYEFDHTDLAAQGGPEHVYRWRR